MNTDSRPRHTPLLLVSAILLLAACETISGPADIQVLRESRLIGDVRQMDVDLKYDVGQLEITRSTGENLFSIDLQYDRRRYDSRFRFDAGERASLRLDLNGRSGFNPGGGKDNTLTLRLTDKIPLDLHLAAGVSESHLELGGLKIRRMRLRGGVGKTDVSFDKPSGQAMSSLDVESGVGEMIIHGLGNVQVEQIDFKGGVGHAELDFTGDAGMSRTQATVKVGVGAVRLTVPRDADVEIEAQGSFLSNISAPSFQRNGHSYIHRGNGGPTLRIRVESGVGGVEVELI
jgi:hypothetical protein